MPHYAYREVLMVGPGDFATVADVRLGCDEVGDDNEANAAFIAGCVNLVREMLEQE